MEEVELLKKENAELLEQVESQGKLINRMRNVLRFCARNDAGTYYQHETAKKMLLENVQIVWDRYNEDGTTADSYRKWIYDCAESREKGGGKKALMELDEYEKELLGK